jgi:hypothetical protein
MIGWPIDGTEIMVKDEKEIFERVSPPVLSMWPLLMCSSVSPTSK